MNCVKVVRLKPDQPNQWLRACSDNRLSTNCTILILQHDFEPSIIGIFHGYCSMIKLVPNIDTFSAYIYIIWLKLILLIH